MLRKVEFQHGDVIFFREKKVGKDFKEVEIKDNYIIEKGEGVHTHFISSVKDLKVFENAKKEIALLVTTPVEIDHEEHGSKLIRPGILEKGIENEYDSEKDEERKTMD